MSNELMSLFKSYVRHSEMPRPIGRDGRIRVNTFLDLMTAAHNPQHLDMMADYFCNWIMEISNLDEFIGIATPKRGNILLSYKIASLLNKKSCFVKHDIIFGKWIEGPVCSGDSVIIIDDVASDGELLIDSIESLRKEGIFTNKVLFFVERTEGDAKTLLHQNGTQYECCFSFSDQDLMKLL
ncbi:MAG: hypothetical protein AAF228_13660 [Pseudomonadota bacterium]